MFDNLIDNMNPDSWQEIPAGEKKEADFKEYHVNRHHKQIDDTTIQFLVAAEDGEPKNVRLNNCLSKKNPLDQVGLIEIKLNSEENEILGLDLNGDIIVRK